MKQLWVKPRELTTWKLVATTKNIELSFWMNREEEYKQRGFDTKWTDVNNMDHVH